MLPLHHVALNAARPVIVSCGVVVLAILCSVFSIPFGSVIFAQDQKAPVVFTPSFETTRYTEPLTKKGRVDYVAALNAKRREGVDQENNFAIPLIQAVGGVMDGRVLTRECKELGIDVPERRQDGIVTFYEYAKNEKATKAELDFILQMLQKKVSPSNKVKFVKNWLDQIENALDQLVAETSRPHLYFPRHSKGLLMGIALPDVLLLDSVSRTLLIRANLRLGDKEYDRALDDLLAINRASCLVDKGSFLIERNIAAQTRHVFIHGIENYVSHVPRDTAEIKKILDVVKQDPELPPLEYAFENDRLILLDVVQAFAVGDEKLENLLDPNEESDWKTRVAFRDAIDWNQVLKGVNREFDELIAVVNEVDIPKREEGFEKLFDKLNSYTDDVQEMSNDDGSIFGSYARKSKQELSDLFMKIVVSNLTPDFRKSCGLHLRAQVERDCLIIALAMQLYYRDHGSYPGKIEELMPKYLDALPKNRLADTSYQFKANKKELVVFTADYNDNGKSEKADADSAAEDWGVSFKFVE